MAPIDVPLQLLRQGRRKLRRFSLKAKRGAHLQHNRLPSDSRATRRFGRQPKDKSLGAAKSRDKGGVDPAPDTGLARFLYGVAQGHTVNVRMGNGLACHLHTLLSGVKEASPAPS